MRACESPRPPSAAAATARGLESGAEEGRLAPGAKDQLRPPRRCRQCRRGRARRLRPASRDRARIAARRAAMTMLRDAARAFMPYPEAPVGHAADGPLAGLTFAVKDL